MKGYVLKRHPKGTYSIMKAECAKPFGFARFVTHINSLKSSIKFLQVSVRACSVRVPPMSLINWIWFYPSALHLLRTSFPKAANQGGKDRPQGMGLDVGAFLSV